MDEKHFVSIWFIIGCLLLLFGLIIFSANVVNYFTPVFPDTTVLKELHAGIWWGGLLIVIGLIYTIGFNPWKNQEPT